MYQVAPKKHTSTSKSRETILLKRVFNKSFIMLAPIKSRMLELQLIQNKLDTIFRQNFDIFDEIWQNFVVILKIQRQNFWQNIAIFHKSCEISAKYRIQPYNYRILFRTILQGQNEQNHTVPTIVLFCTRQIVHFRRKF
jgi:hypothetical protein